MIVEEEVLDKKIEVDELRRAAAAIAVRGVCVAGFGFVGLGVAPEGDVVAVQGVAVQIRQVFAAVKLVDLRQWSGLGEMLLVVGVEANVVVFVEAGVG
ncbi:hypothetical protein FBU30_003360 [Linnemannia zychae]|nr:hypothetical protein FBU30_003360 [Linnemannia zychae]